RSNPQRNYSWDFKSVLMHVRMTFPICEEDYLKARDHRSSRLFRSVRDHYMELIEYDSKLIEQMVESYKDICYKYNLDFWQSLHLIVGSIQHIPYTLVIHDNSCPRFIGWNYFFEDCSVRDNGNGCCENVKPFGLYSPLEFAYNKTGDCDTRTVFAYTVLSKLGYDVTV